MSEEDEEEHVGGATGGREHDNHPSPLPGKERVEIAMTIRAKLYAAIVMTVLGPVVIIAVALGDGRARDRSDDSRTARRAGRPPCTSSSR